MIEPIDKHCLTPGAVYHTHIRDNGITLDIELPFNLELSTEDASVLENKLHNTIEMLISEYFPLTDI